MAWGPKPKLLAELNRTFTIGEKTFHVTVKRTSQKRPERDMYGRTSRGKWVETVSTTGYCEEYPSVYWWPYNDFGNKYATFSCDGCEPETPEFDTVQGIVEALIFQVKGWEMKETADELIAKIGA